MQFVVDVNMESDKKSFKKYLLDSEYNIKFPHVKKSIFRSYSSLYQKFESSEDIDELNDFINSFVEKKYQQFWDKINLLIEKMNHSLSIQWQGLISWLEKLMNYRFDVDYFYVFPTFMPVSTFWDSIAKISIMEYVFKDTPPFFIDILIHEISHIIFEKKVIEFNLRFDDITYYYFKEILAPIIVRSGMFNNIRQSENLKFANPELQLLNISYNWIIINMIDYFENKFVDMSKNADFDRVFLAFSKIFIWLSNQFKIKRKKFFEIWFNSNDKENSIKRLNECWYFDGVLLED